MNLYTVDCSYYICNYLCTNVCIIVEHINPGTLRLAESKSPNEGKIEMFIGNDWVRVCDDGWGNKEARVVCRQLGFGTRGRVQQLQSSGSREMPTSNFDCNGNEPGLLRCSHSGWNKPDCNNFDDVEVTCTGTLPGCLLASYTTHTHTYTHAHRNTDTHKHTHVCNQICMLCNRC